MDKDPVQDTHILLRWWQTDSSLPWVAMTAATHCQMHGPWIHLRSHISGGKCLPMGSTRLHGEPHSYVNSSDP